MALGRAGLVWRTLRYLRPRQAWHQALRVLGRQGRALAQAKGRWMPARAGNALEALGTLGPVDIPAHAIRTADGWASGRLLWLGNDVAWNGDWRMPGPSPLWRYHLHYHEHLADAAWVAGQQQNEELARRVLADASGWIETWKGGGSPAWDAYPTAVRLVSWLRILAWAGPLRCAAESENLMVWIPAHVEHLARNLEWHLEGNHILRDAWALAIGAACIEGSPARSVAARRLFEKLMREQVHPDGWHEERSPMYHARALRDALEVQAVLAATGLPLTRDTSNRIEVMQGVLPWLLRSDGTLWQLNDTALDHGVDVSRLLPEGSISAVGTRWFRDAEVAVVNAAGGDRLRIDLGGPAPAHQPGHAHAGALGFECDVSGRLLVADGGVAGYDGDAWRPWLRSTSSHSTVVVDGRDQSELWATFRLGARARVITDEVSGAPDGFCAVARCRPYHAEVEHQRRFTRTGRRIVIEDRVDGAEGRCVESFVHFAPEWEASAVGDAAFQLRSGEVTVRVEIEGPSQITLHRGSRDPILGWRARGFNDVVPAFALRLREAPYRGGSWRITIIPE